MSGYRTEPLSKTYRRRRGRVLAMHGGVCHICGLPGATEVDHVIPTSRGGTDAWENLRPAHGLHDRLADGTLPRCHATKTSREAGKRPRAREAEPHPGDLR